MRLSNDARSSLVCAQHDALQAQRQSEGAAEAAVRETLDALASAADGTEPPSDLNADADFRRHLARVLTSRALQAAAGSS